MNKRTIGAYYEQKAIEYLKSIGYRIIETNYRCHLGEIDIIGKDKEYLAFIEVKYRKKESQGYPYEAVNYVKQRKISKVASHYIITHKKAFDYPCRFDVISIFDKEIELFKNAFDYI
ncbi:MAG: YraN family protein [Lachnospiraceae bacterium]|jgi:putative endonuclease|nr:YraN family protein [Lachnospiraceae bacterium]